jgi:hypothetical protein
MTELLLDAAGRRRSPATMPGFHASRPPRTEGIRYPADPPTVEERVAGDPSQRPHRQSQRPGRAPDPQGEARQAQRVRLRNTDRRVLKGHHGHRTWTVWAILAYDLDTIAVRAG